MAGYHLKHIEKGTIGEFSKVKEEFQEFLEAIEQNSKIMAILELSDLLGAIEHYYRTQLKLQEFYSVINTIKNTKDKLLISTEDLIYTFNQCETNSSLLLKLICDIHHYVNQFNLTIQDLTTMSKITQRVFMNGYR